MIDREFEFGHPGFVYLTDLLQQQKASKLSGESNANVRLEIVLTADLWSLIGSAQSSTYRLVFDK